MWQTFHTACAFTALLSSNPIPQLLLFPLPQINSFTGSFQHEDNPYTKNSSSVSHLLNRDKGSKEKGWRGWKSALVSLEDCVSRLPAATPLPMLALKRTAPCQPCTNQTLFSWPHKLPGATVTDRQTDYIACLWVIIQPCLITYAPSSLSLPFLALSSWWRGLRPSLHFW